MDLKETLFRTMKHGSEVLEEIEISRKQGNDILTEKGKADQKIMQLHMKKLNLVVVDVEEQTKETKVFRFASKTGYLPPFEAGQFINVFVNIDGVRTSRPYSISSSPRQRGFYEITVARIKTGFVSDYFLDKVKIGDEFEANGPAGVFHYNPVFHPKKSVFLAGGSGVTPFLSMTREIVNAHLDREIYLIYGVRKKELAICGEELENYAKKNPNFHYELVLSEPDKDWKGKTGFIDQKLIKSVVGKTDDCEYFICGPEIMNDFCVSELEAMNIPRKRIRREMFGSRHDIQNEPGWPEKLNGNEVFKVKVGGKEIEAKSSDSLLTSLEKAGVKVNVCCRCGGCGLCRVKLVSGNVFMPRGVLLRLADEKFGYIHSCKAYPISDLEIIL